MRLKKVFAILMSMMLVIGLIPVTAQAEEVVYDIIHQPTAGEPYVELNDSTGISYQWYEVSITEQEITDEEATPFSEGGIVYGAYDAETGWSTTDGTYFLIDAEEGETLAVDIIELSETGLLRFDNYNSPEGYVELEITETGRYTITVPVTSTFVMYASVPGMNIKAYKLEENVGDAIEGENSNRLQEPVIGNAYCCKVTTVNGEILTSNVFKNEYAITHQPTYEESYVGLNDNTGATYQWYRSEWGLVEITDETPGVSGDVYGYNNDVISTGIYDEETGWKPGATTMEGNWQYFSILLAEGEEIYVDVYISEGEEEIDREALTIYLENYGYGEYNGVFEESSSEKCRYMLMGEYEGYHDLHIVGLGENVKIRAYHDGDVQTPIDGQTTDTFTGEEPGKYFCEVTFADGNKERSEIFCNHDWNEGYCGECEENHACATVQLDDNGTCMVCGKKTKAAALISGNNRVLYEVVEDAIETAEAGDVVQLLDDFYLERDYTIDTAITLDINGNTIDSASTPELIVNAPIVLKDSVGTGTVESVEIVFNSISTIETIIFTFRSVYFNAEGYTAEDYLAKGYLVHRYDAENGISEEVLDVTGVNQLSNVAVVACKHAWSDSHCSICGMDCTHESYKAGVCELCGKVCTHTWGQYVSDNNATCEKDGTKTKECQICDLTGTIADTGSAKGHKYTNYKSNNDASCTADGTKTASCDNGCGTKNTVTDTGSKKAHVDANKDGKCDIGGETLSVPVQKITYKIAFNGNGATSGTMKAMSNCVSDTEYKLTANAFKKKGYTFNGWNTQKDGKGKSYTNKASIKNLTSKDGATVTLYAQWKKTKYKITYKLNGGKNSKSNKASYYYTTKTFKLKNPTRKGYTFKGWYTDKKCTKKITQIKKGTTKNYTLYAKWAKKKYTISYVLNKGKNNKSNKKSYYVTTKTFKLKNPTRKGYTFKGWYSDKKCTKKVTKITKGTAKNIKLYAKWVKKK